MNKIIKGKNRNNKAAAALFVLQVIVGICPVLLLMAFVWLKLYETPITAAVVIILIFLCNGFCSIGNCPCADLLWTRGQERNKSKQPVTRFYNTRKTR